MTRYLLMALWIPWVAFAELTPPKGTVDPRIRVVDYHPMNVVKLTTFYGVSTHIQFSDQETISDVAVGDDQAWKIIPRSHHLFIRPHAMNADTNVTVVTNKRTYQFALVVQPRQLADRKAWMDPSLTYSLTFRYPDDVAAERVAQTKKEQLEKEQKAIQATLRAEQGIAKNWNYWITGSEALRPTAAYDDGRFIFLTFSHNRDMPAVYSVEADEQESLINTHVARGHTLVIQRMVPRLILRKGREVALIENDSFNLNGGQDSATGTVAPQIERVLKDPS